MPIPHHWASSRRVHDRCPSRICLHLHPRDPIQPRAAKLRVEAPVEWAGRDVNVVKRAQCRAQLASYLLRFDHSCRHQVGGAGSQHLADEQELNPLHRGRSNRHFRRRPGPLHGRPPRLNTPRCHETVCHSPLPLRCARAATTRSKHITALATALVHGGSCDPHGSRQTAAGA